MFTVDREKLEKLCKAMMDGHISYGYGKKASLHAEVSKIKSIDCSGFTRYLMNKVTDGKIEMVDGSDEQNSWCKKQKLTKEPYRQVASLSDGKLRIAFMPRVYENKKVVKAGHVWLLMDGMTLESHGRKGPNRRKWNNANLTGRVKSCYVLANLFSLAGGLKGLIDVLVGASGAGGHA